MRRTGLHSASKLSVSPYTLFYYDKWGKYKLSKNPRGWYTAYTRLYPQYTPKSWKEKSAANHNGPLASVATKEPNIESAGEY